MGYAGGAASAAPTPFTNNPNPFTIPIPSIDYCRPGIPNNVYLDDYIPKAAAAQSSPGLPRGFWLTSDDYVLIPDGPASYSIHDIEEWPPRIIAHEPHGKRRQLEIMKPGRYQPAANGHRAPPDGYPAGQRACPTLAAAYQETEEYEEKVF